jgi:hypothetical protein
VSWKSDTETTTGHARQEGWWWTSNSLTKIPTL